jgi:hypothetical protein
MIDFTFYRLLLNQHGYLTQNYQVLKTYAGHLREGDRIVLKVPQLIMAQKIRRDEQYIENTEYLIFTEQFYEATINLLGTRKLKLSCGAG